MTGIAIKNGFIKDVNAKLMDFFPEYDTAGLDLAFRKITLAHLLTMSPGFNINDTPQFDPWHTNANPTNFIFRLNVEKQPGSELKYNDPAIHLLSVILKKATGLRSIDFAEKYLYSKLGMEPPDWQRDPQGNNWGNFRSSYRPRDLLKFGYLYLNKGRWEDETIIDPEFIEASTSTRISGEMFGFRMNFGYLWYIGNVSGVKLFNASGYGGQYIYVIPEMETVVVCSSDVDRHHGDNYGLISQFIIPLADQI